MAKYGSLLILTQDEREELSGWAQSRTLPAGDVFRARLILALADGWSYSEIEQRLNTSSPTIARWRGRFEQKRMEGLIPRHKGSQPRVVTPAVQARIVRHTLQKPNDGSTHWSCRKLAQELGVSKSSIQRVWTQAQLKPHRVDSYMASDDPELERKLTTSLVFISIHHATRRCSVWTKRRPSRRWTDWTQSCLFRRDEPNATALSTIATARSPSMRR